MEKIIRTGLIGFGVSGQVFHAPFLTTLEGYRLDAIVQRHDQTASRAYPGISVRKSPEEVWKDPQIDLVVITVPTSGHYSLALNALRAKKHVVLEKPITVTSREALDLIRVAREMGVVLSPYHNRRYTGDFRTIRTILKKGSLGRIVEFEAHYDRFRPGLRPGAWREQALPGSGILYDLGAHLIDQALVLFGAPGQISSSLRIQRPGAGATDYFDLRLDYPDLPIRLKSGMLVLEQGPRYMVHGDHGSFVKYGEDPQEALLRSGVSPAGKDWGMESKEFWGILHTVQGDQQQREACPTLAGNFGDYYRDLHETITAGKPLQVRPEDGYNTIRVIELAMESHRLGKTLDCTGLL